MTLSIVIVNFNYGRFIEEAILSVLNQVDDRVELIVVDGGSTDNSVEVIKKYEDRLAWWVSEPDKGQSDAFNKGFARAKGKYLSWLNADDAFVEGSLKYVLDMLESHPSEDWFTANLYRFTVDNKVFECAWGPNYFPKILQRPGMPIGVWGSTTFFSKKLFNRVGGMKVNQFFIMDVDLWTRFIQVGAKQFRINRFCWAFRMHADSKTAEYGEHRLIGEKRTAFDDEYADYLRSTRYQFNKFLRWAILAWRLLDGSILKSIWLRRTCIGRDRSLMQSIK